MKKVTLIAACCLTLCLLTACGNLLKSNSDVSDISVTGADGTVYNSYQTACSNGDFDAARDYIGKLKERYVLVKGDDEQEALQTLIQEAEAYVENQEIQYLASLNEEMANNRIILILTQKPVDGLEAAENARVGKDLHNGDVKEAGKTDQLDNYKRYIAWCNNFNSTCTTVFSIAIAFGNESLAKKMLHVFRPDPEIREEGQGFGFYDVYAHYTNSSLEAAQKKYDEAVKSGAFTN